jgi:nitrogen fixation protein
MVVSLSFLTAFFIPILDLEELMSGANFEELMGGVKLEELMGGMNMTELMNGMDLNTMEMEMKCSCLPSVEG